MLIGNLSTDKEEPDWILGANGPICLSNNNFWLADKFATLNRPQKILAIKNTGIPVSIIVLNNNSTINVPDWISGI